MVECLVVNLILVSNCGVIFGYLVEDFWQVPSGHVVAALTVAGCKEDQVNSTVTWSYIRTPTRHHSCTRSWRSLLVTNLATHYFYFGGLEWVELVVEWTVSRALRFCISCRRQPLSDVAAHRNSSALDKCALCAHNASESVLTPKVPRQLFYQNALETAIFAAINEE